MAGNAPLTRVLVCIVCLVPLLVVTACGDASRSDGASGVKGAEACLRRARIEAASAKPTNPEQRMSLREMVRFRTPHGLKGFVAYYTSAALAEIVVERVNAARVPGLVFALRSRTTAVAYAARPTSGARQLIEHCAFG